MSSHASHDYEEIDRLVEEFAARYRRGERPSVQEYLDRHPDLADVLRELLPAQAEIEQVRAEVGEPAGERGHAGIAAAPPLRQLGDYQILREVGHGGMGVVYEAEQLALGRHVALKVLSAQSLRDPKRLLRFQREARAAARLHHTNIVPVFGVGESDGLHYYVMQFIPGLGLDEVLQEIKRLRQSQPGSAAGAPASAGGRVAGRELTAAGAAEALLTGEFLPQPPPEDAASPAPVAPRPAACPPAAAAGGPTPPAMPAGAVSPDGSRPDSSARWPGQADRSAFSESGRPYYQSVARVGIQVAEALADAHGQGVLHRDIKPSNLLLDGQGTVWVTDFGLAKATSEGDDLTQTGDLVGTFRYMAPERFSGQADVRSDVYALGLTLYELLALRPAYAEADQRRLMYQVLHEEPLPLRRLCPGVPRDLETVIQKAMARDPGGRYQTATALAEDLKRFAEDRPIRARRVSTAERLGRWCRRNPLVAGLLAAVALLLVAGTGFSLYFGIRAAGEAEKARRQAEERGRELYISNVNRALSEWQGNQVILAERLLDQCPEDLRGWEWHYGKRLCYLNPVTIYAYNAPVIEEFYMCASRSVAFSRPDGKWVAAADWDNTLKLWDTGTGQLVRTLRGDPGIVVSLAFSPDGKLLASGGLDKAVRLWNPHTGELVRTLRGHRSQVQSLAFRPDGKTLASASRAWSVGAPMPKEAEIIVWDITTGRRLGRNVARSPDDQLWSVGLSPDGTQFATGSVSGWVQLGDTMTGACVRTWSAHRGRVMDIAFSPVGALVATGGWDNTVRLWDRTTRSLIHTLRGHTGQVLAVVFSPDGKWIATGSQDNMVKLWDTGTGEEIATFRGHRAFVISVAFSPDGHWLASAGQEGTVKLWDVSRGPEPLTLRGHTGWVMSAVFSRDSQWLFSAAGSWRKDGIKVWDLHTGKERAVLGDGRSFLSNIALSPDGTRVAAAGKQGVDLWDAKTGKELPSLGGKLEQIDGVAISADGRLLACTSGNQLVLLDARTGQESGSWRAGSSRFYAAVFSPDSTRLAAMEEDQVIIWDLSNRQNPLSLPVSAGGLPVIGSPADKKTSILAFSPDGKCLAAADGSQIILCNAATGRVLHRLIGHSHWINCVAFSHDGKRLASGSGPDHHIKIWDTTTGKEVFTLRGHSGGILSLAFSRDGHRLASSSIDWTVKVWDATPVWPQHVHQKRAYELVVDLLRQFLSPREVVERLRADPTLTEPVREIALALALKDVQLLGSEALRLTAKERLAIGTGAGVRLRRRDGSSARPSSLSASW